MAGIEANIIQDVVDQIEGFKKIIEKAGQEGRNKLESIKLDEVLKEVPLKDGKVISTDWSSRPDDQKKKVHDKLILVRDALHSASELDGPTNPKNIMYAEYASNTTIVIWTLLGFLLIAFLLVAIVPRWDQATGYKKETLTMKGEQEPIQKQDQGAAAKQSEVTTAEDKTGKGTGPEEGSVLTMVILLGALGGSLHLVSSLVMFIGNRQLKRSWLPYYLAMPFTGAGLAPVVYMLLRVGLITPSGTATGGTGLSNLNFIVIYAFAVLTGLFSRVALDKLGEIFGTIFKTQTPPSKDPLAPKKPANGGVPEAGKSP